MAKDYIYAVTPLLVDAMMERDQVHRQIAIDAVAHLSLGKCDEAASQRDLGRMVAHLEDAMDPEWRFLVRVPAKLTVMSQGVLRPYIGGG